MFRLIFILLFGLDLGSVWAKVQSFETPGLQRKSYTLKQACELMKHEALLVGTVNLVTFDCTGKHVDAYQFCEAQGIGLDKRPKPDLKPLLRGWLDEKLDMIHCDRTEQAILKLDCKDKHTTLCLKPQASCEALKKVWARSHQVTHASAIKLGSGEQLNCYFSIHKS